MSLLLSTFKYPDDYAPVYEFWESIGGGIRISRSDEPDEIKKKIQRDPDLFILAKLDGELVGTVLGGFDGRRGMMYHLAVHPDHRYQGIANSLVQELENRLKAKGCIRYYLMVTPDNIDGKSFYDHGGWERMDISIYARNLE